MPAAKHTKSKSVGSAVVFGTVNQIIGQFGGSAIGIVILKIITSSLGVTGYGVYAAAVAYVTTFSILTDLGVNAVTPRAIATNPDRADHIARSNMGVRLFLCAVTVPVLFAVSWVLYPHTGASFHLSILIASVMLFGDAFRSIFYAILIATYRNSKIGFINLAQQALLLCLVVVCSDTLRSVAGYLACFVISYAVSAVIAFYAVSGKTIGWPTFSWVEFRSILKDSGPIGLLQIVNMLYLKFALILLSLISTFAAVGVYSLAYTLISPFVFIPSFIMSALIPALATSSESDQKVLIEKAFHYMCSIAALLGAAGFIVSSDLVRVIAPHAFSNAALCFELLLLGTSFSYLTTVFSYSAISLGRHRKLVFASIVTLALNVGLNTVLIPEFNVSGAATATAIGDLALLVGVYLIFRSESGIRIKIFWPIVRSAAIGGIAYAATRFAQNYFSGFVPITRLVVSCVILASIYVVIGLAASAFPEPLRVHSLSRGRV
jgi:O-antigen/teichoic acid export membrane protein